MEDSNIVLSAPLQQLKDEHVSLREEMELIYEITEDMELESAPVVIQLFKKLHEQIFTFVSRLEKHSKREEEALFPMMTRHLGENDRTIEVMEYEHEKAMQHLTDFLNEAHQAIPTINENDALSIATFAVQAHTTLIQHFAKEEKVLFPMAEKTLSIDEKKELVRLFQT